MKKVSKKEIRQAVEKAIKQVLLIFGVSAPSKKTRKSLDSLSKKVAREAKSVAKKNQKTDKKTNVPPKKTPNKIARRKV